MKDDLHGYQSIHSKTRLLVKRSSEVEFLDFYRYRKIPLFLCELPLTVIQRFRMLDIVEPEERDNLLKKPFAFWRPLYSLSRDTFDHLKYE